MQRKYKLVNTYHSDTYEVSFDFEGQTIDHDDITHLKNDIERSGDVKLSFRLCSITDDVFKCMCEFLKHNTSVTVLWFEKTIITADGVKILSDALKLNTGIIKLFIDGSNSIIGNSGAKILGEILEVNQSIKEFALIHCGINDVGFKYICQFLKKNTGLTKLNLRDNKYNIIFCTDYLEHILRKDNFTLLQYIPVELDLRRNHDISCLIKRLEKIIDNGNKLLDGKTVSRNLYNLKKNFEKTLKTYKLELDRLASDSYLVEAHGILITFERFINENNAAENYLFPVFKHQFFRELVNKCQTILGNRNVSPNEKNMHDNDQAFSSFSSVALKEIMLKIFNDISVDDINSLIQVSSNYYKLLVPYLRYSQALILLDIIKEADHDNLKAVISELNNEVLFQPVIITENENTENISPLQYIFKIKDIYAFDIVLKKIQTNSDLIVLFVNQYYDLKKTANIDNLLVAYDDYCTAYDFYEQSDDNDQLYEKAGNLSSVQEKLYRHLLNNFCSPYESAWNIESNFDSLGSQPQCTITLVTENGRGDDFILTPENDNWLSDHILFRGNKGKEIHVGTLNRTYNGEPGTFFLYIDKEKLQADKNIFKRLWEIRTQQMATIISSLENKFLKGNNRSFAPLAMASTQSIFNNIFSISRVTTAMAALDKFDYDYKTLQTTRQSDSFFQTFFGKTDTYDLRINGWKVLTTHLHSLKRIEEKIELLDHALTLDLFKKPRTDHLLTGIFGETFTIEKIREAREALVEDYRKQQDLRQSF